MKLSHLGALVLPVVLALGQIGLSHSAVAAPKLTAVNIDTLPPGAEVTLVEPAPEKLLGITPLKKIKMPQGAVKLRLKLPGYEEKMETITIGPKETTFNFELVRKIVPATLDLTGDAASTGADVVVDGDVKGKLPVKVSVSPGRHQVVVRKTGYVSWEKWADVTENQTATFEIALKAQDKPKGSLLISSTPAGADVRLNGAPKGKAPQMVENLDAGSFEVELSLENYKPFRQSVAVGEGKRETVSGTLEPLAVATPVGELTVLCDAPKGTITIDGEDKGPQPAKVAGLKAGEHIVECTAPGYPKAQQVVIVKAGETKTVQLSPKQAVAASRGAISVVCNVATAKAKIGDGEAKKTPCQFDDLAPGNHQVTITADGYAPQTKTVAVEATKTTEIKFELAAMGKIKVTVAVGKRANVYIDGEIRGQAPLTVEVAVGAHKVEVKEDGTGVATESLDVPVVAGQTATVDAKLVPPPAPKLVRRSNPTSAHVNDAGNGTIQLGVGIPAILEARITAGILDNLSAGLEIRNTAAVLTEFELQATYRLAGSNAFAVAAMAGLGGGLGASERNSFTITAKGIASLLLGDTSAFSLYAQYRFFTDKVRATADRSTGSQLPIGLQGEFMYSNAINLWGKVEMDFAFPAGRAIYNEVDSVLNGKIRGGVGLTWLFK